MKKERTYYIDPHISCCFPFKTEKKVLSYGVLSSYINKEYTRNEIDKIITEMVVKHPYVKNAMYVHIWIMCKWEEPTNYPENYTDKKRIIHSTYHNLYFKNDNYKEKPTLAECGTTIEYEL